jgi:lipid-A-disaccharide synthase
MSAGEPSGDASGAALAQAVRSIEPETAFTGIGAERMRAAGFALSADSGGWASMGPLAALGKIPPLYAEMWKHALTLRAHPADVVVLVDFGVFNLRLAKTLRMIGYRAPVVYYFPPGAWLDRYGQAHAVARYTRPLTAFAHQRDYYRWLGLDAAYFGHPLASVVSPRPERPAPSPGGGSVALLPGSREREIERHLDRLLAAFGRLRERRPALRAVAAAAHAGARRLIAERIEAAGHAGAARVVDGAQEALRDADGAWVASGTAVLEAALREVPTVALYVVSPREVEIGRKMWHGPFITLPNILLGRELVPELLQAAASPERLAAEMDRLLNDPSAQLAGMREMRALLGPPDALQQCAQYVVAAARGT